MSKLMRPDPLYGVAFSNSPQHLHRIALSTILSGPTNKLMIVEPSDAASQTFGSSDFQQIASSPLTFPATKIGWEPKASVAGSANQDVGGRGELLASTGDVLRIWEVAQDQDDYSGYVGREAWPNGSGRLGLTTRSVLTNVS